MRCFLLSVFLLLIISSTPTLSAVSATINDNDNQSDDVVRLTNETFYSFIHKELPSIIRFGAWWSGHCKALQPIFALSARVFRGEKIAFGEIDIADYPDIGRLEDIAGYPSIIFYQRGKGGDPEREKYYGKRTVDDIVNYLNDRLGTNIDLYPNVIRLNESNFESMVKDSKKNVFVHFFDIQWESSVNRFHFFLEVNKLGLALSSDQDNVIARTIVWGYGNGGTKKYRPDYDDLDAIKEGYPNRNFYPMIYFPKENKVGIIYQGNHSSEGLIDFIQQLTEKQKQSNSWSIPIPDQRHQGVLFIFAVSFIGFLVCFSLFWYRSKVKNN